MSILVFIIVIIWFFLLSFVFFKEDFILFFFSSDIMELTEYCIFLHKYYRALNLINYDKYLKIAPRASSENI